MEKEFELNECLEKIYSDTYLTDMVREYDENKTKEKLIDVYKVLSYRDIFAAYTIIFKNKKLEKKLKKESSLSIEEITNEENCVREILKAQNYCGDENDYLICVFTDPTKIDFETMPVNSMELTDLKKLWEPYSLDEKCDGIIINPKDECLMIDKCIVELILSGNYDGINEILTLLEKVENANDGDEIIRLLKEYLGDFDEDLESI